MRCQALQLEIPKTDATHFNLVRYDARGQSAKVGLRDPPLGGCADTPKALLNRPLSFNESTLHCYSYGVCPVIGAELGKNTFHMGFHSGVGYPQL